MSNENTTLPVIDMIEVPMAVQTVWSAGAKPWLWSAPGHGKTSAIRALALDLGARLVVTNGAFLNPEHLGIPMVTAGDDSKLRMALLDVLPWDTFVGGGKVVWLLDELDRAFPSVQNTLLSLVLDGELCGNRLGPNVRIVAAGNGSTDSRDTYQPSLATGTRFVHLSCHAKSLSPAVETCYRNSGAAGSDLSMLESLFTPSADGVGEVLLGSGPELDVSDFLTTNPRTVETFLRLARTAWPVAKKSGMKEETMKAVLAGTVGPAQARTLLDRLGLDSPTAMEDGAEIVTDKKAAAEWLTVWFVAVRDGKSEDKPDVGVPAWDKVRGRPAMAVPLARWVVERLVKTKVLDPKTLRECPETPMKVMAEAVCAITGAGIVKEVQKAIVAAVR